MISDAMLRAKRLRRKERLARKYQRQRVHHCACGQPAVRFKTNDWVCDECDRVLGIYYRWRNTPSESLYSEHRIVPCAALDMA